MILYMNTVVKLYPQKRWKDSDMPPMEEWMVKMTQLAEMAELTCLLRVRSTISAWKL